MSRVRGVRTLRLYDDVLATRLLCYVGRAWRTKIVTDADF